MILIIMCLLDKNIFFLVFDHHHFLGSINIKITFFSPFCHLSFRKFTPFELFSIYLFIYFIDNVVYFFPLHNFYCIYWFKFIIIIIIKMVQVGQFSSFKLCLSGLSTLEQQEQLLLWLFFFWSVLYIRIIIKFLIVWSTLKF